MYAATDGGVYFSTNRGINWRSRNTGLKTTTTRALAIDPANSQTLYVGTTKGFFKSVNGATNWTLFTNGLGRPTIHALLLDTAAPTTLYAGTTNGLFKSLDAGTNWFPSQTNLATRDVVALAFPSGSTATLYAGTRGTNFAGGTNDAFLVKFAPDGQSLDYAFTFGGSRDDQGWSVAVHTNGHAFVVGQTASVNFPVAGLFTGSTASQTNNAGKTDVFVAEFDAAGTTQIFSIYLGGSQNDFGHAIALDPAGNAYIVGQTFSSKFPITNGLQTVSSDPLKYGGSGDSFVAKLLTGLPAMSVQFAVAAAGQNQFPPTSTFQLVVSWPASAPEFILECREPSSGQWLPVPQAPAVVNGRRQVVLPASSASCIFRLRLP